MIAFDTLARGTSQDELCHCGREAWPPHRVTSQHKGLVQAEVTANQGCVEFEQHL
jgi:hypothetical protein